MGGRSGDHWLSIHRYSRDSRSASPAWTLPLYMHLDRDAACELRSLYTSSLSGLKSFLESAPPSL